jgi:hypothetical protein
VEITSAADIERDRASDSNCKRSSAFNVTGGMRRPIAISP